MYNVTTSDIIRLNPGCAEKIYAGQTIKIPKGKDTPVSYTHLDVYKRQMQYSSMPFLIWDFTLSTFIVPFLLNGTNICITLVPCITRYYNCLLYTSRCV